MGEACNNSFDRELATKRARGQRSMTGGKKVYLKQPLTWSACVLFIKNGKTAIRL